MWTRNCLRVFSSFIFYKIKLRRFYFSVWWFIMQSYELGLGEDLGNHLLFIYFFATYAIRLFHQQCSLNKSYERAPFLFTKQNHLAWICMCGICVFILVLLPFSEKKSLRLINKGCILHLRFCWCGATWPPWHLPREEEVGRGENTAQSRFV